jgi:hypothetical protein
VGELLTGDLGTVVLRSLLETGVGYVVSSWQDRPTPIDAAIDDARSMLARRGIVLRRLRALTGLEPLVTSPAGGTGGVAGAVQRGLVIFGGRRGLRPSLETFLRMRVPGGVVGICFDEDAARIEDAVVIDPAPTARGLVRALDAAFAASVATERPALVLVRERLLGMRGTLRRRPDLLPADAADRDAAMPRGMSASDAARVHGLVNARRAPSGAARQPVLVTTEPFVHAVERALSQLAGALAVAGARPLTDDVALVVTSAPGVDLDAGDAGIVLADAPHVAVLAAASSPLHQRLSGTHALHVEPTAARGEEVEAALAQWLLAQVEDAEDPAVEVLERAIEAYAGVRRTGSSRVPRRSDVLHRSISPSVAAGLTLAQGVIGVPTRLHDTHPTYQTDTGVPLTVTSAAVFAEHGAASGAPSSMHAVYLVTGPGGGVSETAGAMGASIEYVDGGSPRAIARAVATACRATRPTAHVIVVTETQRVAAPASSVLGVDPDLVGTERLATATVPVAATALVELGDELQAGPSELLLDHPAARAMLGPVRELTPATWDLRHQADRSGRRGGAAWALRRRAVKLLAGVDL